jgi:hypothetical protein
MKRFISYYRVSTQRQGQSGLGLEAQQASVREFVNGHGELVAEYTEVESGKKADRPQLLTAMAHARRERATLVIAKLDRLARNVRFVATLMESGADFVCCDNPAPPIAKAAGRVGPGGVVCGSSCHDRALGGLHPEIGETHQFARVGFPLGEQVVHCSLAVVDTGPTQFVSDEDAWVGLEDLTPATRSRPAREADAGSLMAAIRGYYG